MKLNTNDRLWAPMDKPRYLLVLPQGTPEPQTRAQFLAANVQMLHRLVDEAGEEEIDEANCRLENLEPEVLDWLPRELLRNHQTPELLTSLQLVEGSPLHEWKKDVDEALSDPRMPETEAMEEAQYLTLAGRISQMIEA
jgi:hypothetical protein